jgi:hypothetical protein
MCIGTRTLTVMVVYNTKQANYTKVPMEYLQVFLHMRYYEKVCIMYFAFLIYSEGHKMLSYTSIKEVSTLFHDCTIFTHMNIK